MSEHDDRTEEQELYEEVPPRSVFAATWFRVLLVVIVLGVIGAVAVPYVLDWMNPPGAPRSMTAKAPAAPPATPALVTPEKTSSEPVAPPATPAPTVAAPLARPEPATPPVAAAPSRPTSPASETKAKTAMAVTEPTGKAAATPPTAKPEAAAQTASPTKAEPTKAEPAKTEPPKTEPAKAPAAKPEPTKPAAKDVVASTTTPAAKRPASPATMPTATESAYWVQVGAFKDAETAKRLAAKLREENFKVEESVTRVGGGAVVGTSAAKAPAAKPGAAGSEAYDVYVTGQAPEDLTKRLAAKGLTAESAGTGLVVKPSLPLRDAVALSKDLAMAGFKVQVRRAGGDSKPAPAAPAPSTTAGSELHRVRIGAFADRAAAQAAARQLEAKGYKPYIARGDQ